MAKKRPSFYGILPAAVRYDAEIPFGARVLYAEITALCGREGYCWATNKYFAENFGQTPRTVQSWLSALQDRGHISIEIDREHGNERHIWILHKVEKKSSRPSEENFASPSEEIFTPILMNNTSLEQSDTNNPPPPQGGQQAAGSENPPEEEPDPIPYHEIVEAYNNSLREENDAHPVMQLTEKRRDLIRTRWQESTYQKHWQRMFRMRGESDLLCRGSASHPDFRGDFE